MHWKSDFDNTHRAEDLPPGLSFNNYLFVSTLNQEDIHHHLNIVVNTWRNGGELVREGETSFMQTDIPDISSFVSEKLVSNCSTDDWPKGANAYNFSTTNWFSCIIQGNTTSSFISEGESTWHSVTLGPGFTSSWSDGFPRLPRVPHKRLNDNNCITFCILPKTEFDIGLSDSTQKHSIPYRYEYFSVSAGDTIRTRVCNSEYSGNLILAKGSIKDHEGISIPYYTKQNQTFTALEDTIAISCVRY